MGSSARVFVRKGRVQPIAHRHPWLFAGSIGRVEGQPASGAIVDVLDPSGRFLGRGFYSEQSAIRVRLFAHRPGAEADREFFVDRITRAARFRRDVLGLPQPGRTTAYRLLHGEADGLPGLVVDVYGEILVLQISHAALEQRKAILLEALLEVLGPRPVLQRDDPHFRSLEGLPPIDEFLVDPVSRQIEVLELGLRFHVDLGSGQKTGLYLDQRHNRALASTLAAGRRVLDAFTYCGGFALHCAREGSTEIVAIDSSAPAIERGQENARLNEIDGIEFVCEDAFAYLGARRGRAAFDLVFIDPPAYARRRKHRDAAIQKYIELNTLAAQNVAPGGILVTSSCSGAVGEGDLESIVARAALRSHRKIRIFLRGGQSPDHPIDPACPEGRYLETLFCQVDG